MGMKVAAVSLMCQDERVFTAMEMAGTPCPYMGTIGVEAQENWERNPQDKPGNDDPLEHRFRAADSNSEYEYRVWTKEDFCNEIPDENICKS